ncbi:hypothetical protein I858_010960 [Planococcus versutus]|uniref:Uncharacterized protein n=1 Tax=Planococcus versutus TaxID=1302659 RepID=A0A1B1S2U5_9BACL|nr:hypothetical protein I858_010960 [Planococcus versutus]
MKGKDMLLHRCASFVAKPLPKFPSVTDFPAEKRRDETPQELATRRLSAESLAAGTATSYRASCMTHILWAQSVRLVWRIIDAYKKNE